MGGTDSAVECVGYRPCSRRGFAVGKRFTGAISAFASDRDICDNCS